MKKQLILSVLLSFFALLAYQSTALAAKYELSTSSRVILEIDPDMTLDQIIEEIYPEHQLIWPQIKEKLMTTNPRSFQPGTDRLLRGSRLKLIEVNKIHEQLLLSKTKVGYIANITGQASVRDINGRFSRLQQNTIIYEGDRVETPPGSELAILMDDGAEIFLKEDSVIKVSEYRITEDYGVDSSSVLDLLRGGFRKITGAIGASALSNYKVQVGLVTIGVRGTEYVVKLCAQDDCTQTVSRNDPDAKLHAVVLKGAITLTTDEEVQILMALGEYGTASSTELKVEETEEVPVGFLNEDESYKFNVTIPQQLAAEEEESGINWGILLGGLLLLGLAL